MENSLGFSLFTCLCANNCRSCCLYLHLFSFTFVSFISFINYNCLHKLSSSVELSGRFEQVATDFGNQFHYLPSGVIHPNSIQDIAQTITDIYQLGGSDSTHTVTARGNGHSTGGQSLAYGGGIVVKMQALKGRMNVSTGSNNVSYIDVYGGQLWIDVLCESLRYGLTPVSWTDYLHLTVGGTLSHAGISGQTFKYGPQISNVHQLEVITGRGEVRVCSEKRNADLFFAVLGGLGQFGVITRARIALAPAPKMVKWIRVAYTDFLDFSNDQEHLITSKTTFDYIEGFIKIRKPGTLNNWWPSFTARDPVAASLFNTDGKILYCLDIAKYYNPDKIDTTNEEIEDLLSILKFIPSTLFFTEVSYIEFLNRVHKSEIELRSRNRWNVPHPWLNVLIPKSKIQEFGRAIFGNILQDSSIDLILIYPVNKSKWDERSSVVIPNDDIFYPVGFLSTATSSTDGTKTLNHMVNLNKKILDYCESNNIGMKQYLAHYTSQREWKQHFGRQWKKFVKRKSFYDPLKILAPGQRIFNKTCPIHIL